MNSPADHSWCRVTGSQKLPAEVGGADALCTAMGQALGASRPAAVEVNIVSPYLLSATVVLADGRRLPAVKVGSSDRPLGTRAVKMLADSIAAQVAAQPS